MVVVVVVAAAAVIVVRRNAFIISTTTLMIKSVRSFETLIYCYETTRRYIPEGCHLHTRRRENLISQKLYSLVCDSCEHLCPSPSYK
jgi:hypothetical protein